MTVETHSNGQQYITNQIGKDTNVIRRRGHQLSTLDRDAFLVRLREHTMPANIVAAVLQYDSDSVQATMFTNRYLRPVVRTLVTRMTSSWLQQSLLYRATECHVRYTRTYRHDYTRKFKIIVHKDTRDDEPVGGLLKF